MEHREPGGRQGIMPSDRRHPRLPIQRPWLLGGVTALLALLALTVAACSFFDPVPRPTTSGTDGALPDPSCGGLKVAIEGALPCRRVAEIAVATLVDMAPEHLARGVAAIDVWLGDCPTGEVPAQIDCGTELFAQFVTVTFGPVVPGGPVEPSLTVVVAPVSGDILGIQNPLVR